MHFHHPPRRLGRWPGPAVGVVALAAAAALAAGPATAVESPRAGADPLGHLTPAAQHLLGRALGEQKFMSDGINAISAGSDGVPISAGESLCRTVCNEWFWQPLTERWTGKKWKSIRSVFPGGGNAGFSAVSALSANDVWASGSVFVDSTDRGGLVEHWNGKRWALLPSPSGEDLNLSALSAVADDDVWAAGSSSAGGVIQHWDGSKWAESGSPEVNRKPQSVAAIDGSDAWTVGLDVGAYAAYSEHWDGSSWQDVAVPVPTGSLLSALISVNALAPDDVWAVGASIDSSGETRALTEHWDGSAWSLVDTLDQANCGFNGVSGTASDDVWAVGTCATADGWATLTAHWNGSTWKQVKSPNNKAQAVNQFWGVTAIAPDDVWAAGDSPNTDANTDSVLLAHWNGSKWKLVKAPNPRPQGALAAYAAPTAQRTRLAPAASAASPNAVPQKGVCFSNLDGDTTLGVNSQTYGTDYAAYDDEAAADVTLKKTCKVRSVTVLGTAICYAVQSEQVTFYADKNGHPGKKLNSQTANGDIVDGSCGSFDIPLKTVVLEPGTYWVSVTVNLNIMPSGGRWAWAETSDHTGSSDRWRSKGGAYGLCGRWGDVQACTLADNADLTLQLSSATS